MKTSSRLLRTLAILITAASCSCFAQDRGDWMAASSNAKAITGDVSITGSKVFISLTGFIIAPIRALQPAEIQAVFNTDPGDPSRGNLYRLNVPATKKFLHKNSLCGNEDVQWMVTSASGRHLQVAFFSGDSMPILTIDALQNATDLCGSFEYSR